MSEAVSFDPRIVLRPRSLDEIFDLAMAYGRSYRSDFAKLCAALVIPTAAITLGARQLLELSWAHTWVVALVLSSFLERITISYSGRHLFGNAPSFTGATLTTLKRPFTGTLAALLAPSPLLVALLYEGEEWAMGIGLMLGFFWPFLLAWGIYLSIVLVLEGLELSAASKRSSLLVSYRYGRAIAFVLTTGSLRLLAIGLGDLSMRFVIGFVLQLGEPFDLLSEDGGSWASVLAYISIAPFCALARLFDYVDARTRLEGWDIQVRFKAIAARGAEQRSFGRGVERRSA